MPQQNSTPTCSSSNKKAFPHPEIRRTLSNASAFSIVPPCSLSSLALPPPPYWSPPTMSEVGQRIAYLMTFDDTMWKDLLSFPSSFFLWPEPLANIRMLAWRPKKTFPLTSRSSAQPLQPPCVRTPLFLNAFPAFVSSLSWYNYGNFCSKLP